MDPEAIEQEIYMQLVEKYGQALVDKLLTIPMAEVLISYTDPNDSAHVIAVRRFNCPSRVQDALVKLENFEKLFFRFTAEDLTLNGPKTGC